MMYQDTESLRAYGNEHLEALIAEAETERLAAQLERANGNSAEVREGWLNWLTGWATPTRRRVAHKSV